MERSPEELLAATVEARSNPNLVAIVQATDSPTAAENAALDQEYPLSLVRQVRLLAVLKREWFDTFYQEVSIKQQVIPNPVRIFPCWWNIEEYRKENYLGELQVIPHQVLPPLFWDYQLRDAEGKVLFTCDPQQQKAPNREAEKHGIRCFLTTGSKSLPVGLLVAIHYDSSKKEKTLTFRVRTNESLHDCDFQWSRLISKEIVDSLPIECFSRRYPMGRYSPYDEAVLRPVLPGKGLRIKSPLFFGEGAEYYYLFLTSWVRYPLSEQEEDDGDKKLSSLFQITTCYFLSSPWEAKQSDYDCQRIKEFSFFEPNQAYGHEIEARDVLISHHLLKGKHPLRIENDPLNEVIAEIIKGCPDYLDGLATLWNFFSFKNLDPCNYDATMLVPWHSKEE